MIVLIFRILINIQTLKLTKSEKVCEPRSELTVMVLLCGQPSWASMRVGVPLLVTAPAAGFYCTLLNSSQVYCVSSVSTAYCTGINLKVYYYSHFLSLKTYIRRFLWLQNLKVRNVMRQFC